MCWKLSAACFVERSLNLNCQYCPHIETSQLIFCANQLTGFYMRVTLATNGLNNPEYLQESVKQLSRLRLGL